MRGYLSMSRQMQRRVILLTFVLIKCFVVHSLAALAPPHSRLTRREAVACISASGVALPFVGSPSAEAAEGAASAEVLVYEDKRFGIKFEVPMDFLLRSNGREVLAGRKMIMYSSPTNEK